jgi:hypothetical protein
MVVIFTLIPKDQVDVEKDAHESAASTQGGDDDVD